MASPLRAALLACALILLLSPAPASASTTERRVLAEVNALRAAHGVAPLRYSRSLNRSAGRQAVHILRVNRFRHDRRFQASRRFDLRGEDLAWQPGKRRRAGTVVRMWRASDSHRRVLLDPRFRWGGIGREYGRLGSRRATVWVIHLGAR